MTRTRTPTIVFLTAALALAGVACERPPSEDGGAAVPPASESAAVDPGIYATVRLEADVSGLSDERRRMLGLLIEAADLMDRAFWIQAYGDRQALLDSIDDPAVRRYAEINYGPWDRLNGDEPFVAGVGPKPAGANFYPVDMTREELEGAAAATPALLGQYTMVRRDEGGALVAVPYSEFFTELMSEAATRLEAAAALAEDDGFARYLKLRARALMSDDYLDSDLAWMDMKHNAIDVVIGPIESYEDKLIGRKTSFEAYVLLKDLEWSERLSRYAALLPELQRGLPVPDEYKRETPGSDSDLNAYDVVYYAGDCNAGSKTIAINLPNDERVQLEKGTRRLQLKNAMRAKFDEIMVPIAAELLVEEQRAHVTFDAFFANTMFHEVAHGLGVKNTLDGSGTVRDALREQASALEEGKADVLGLYMVTKLHERGEIGTAPLEDYYTTFLAGIFRSVRFGASSAHGRANMIRFNVFEEQGAFTRDPESGLYRVDFQRMGDAIDSLSATILRLQGDGDYAGAAELTATEGVIGATLQSDLDRLADAGIPVDIVFEQGPDVLGLE